MTQTKTEWNQADVDECLTMYLTSLHKIGLPIKWSEIEPFTNLVSPAAIEFACLMIEE